MQCIRCGIIGDELRYDIVSRRYFCVDTRACGYKRMNLSIEMVRSLDIIAEHYLVDPVDRILAEIPGPWKVGGSSSNDLKDEIRKIMEVVDENKDEVKEQFYINIVDRLKSMWDMLCVQSS